MALEFISPAVLSATEPPEKKEKGRPRLGEKSGQKKKDKGKEKE